MKRQYSSSSNMARSILGAAAILATGWWIPAASAAYSVADDLPGPSAHFETIPAGSLVIPMDNTRQSLVAPFNLKAYGLANRLLHNSIPLKWAIRAGKAKDGTDFTATAFRFAPSATATASISFAGGPFIVHSNYAAAAKVLITAFANNVAVYQLTADTVIDIRHDINFRPHPAVNTLNAGIHTNLLRFAGITNYVAIADTSLLSNSCYTIFMEPHNGITNGVANVRAYLQSGGNLLAQCLAIETYENSTAGHFQSAVAITTDNIFTSLVYSNADLAYSQFIGTVEPAPGGSHQDWTMGGAFHNNGHVHMGATSGSPHFTATASKMYNGPGGMVFYLGGHNYGAGGADLTLINAQRMILNAVFVPNTRAQSCGFTINSAPLANNDTGLTDEDVPLVVAAPGVLSNDTDADGDVLRAVSATNPSHGTVLLSTNGAYTYTPVANYNGPDSFTYRVTDGVLTSAAATVSLTVNSINDAPVANTDNYAIDEDLALNVAAVDGVLANDTDVDGNPLTALLVANVTHGALTLHASGSFTYTPTAHYHGPDSFTYRAADAFGGTSGVATVSITVNSINDAPVANNDSYAINEDLTLNVAASGGVLTNDVDADGDSLTAILVANVTHGALTLHASGSFSYTPTADYHGPDSFTYRAADAFGGTSGVATVSITVNPLNDAPVANAQLVTTAEDTATPIALTGTDVDGDLLTYTVVTEPAHGVLTGTAPNLTYTPDADYHGPDSFTFKVNDGTVDSGNATVSITVTAVNDPPVANAQPVTTAEDTATAITLTGSDVDGDTLVYTVVTEPAHGVLTGTAPNLTYTPDTDYHGPDSFTFNVNDGTVDSGNATVSITVTTVNDLPVANADAYETDEDHQLIVAAVAGVLANDTDVDGDTLSAVLVNPPVHGLLVLNGDGGFTYTPTADFHGTDSFTYKANDGTANSANATVTLTVNSVNDLPVANADSYGTPENTALNISAPGVLENDTDVDEEALIAILVSNPTHAQSFSFNADGSFAYTPVNSYNGPDSFTYVATDGTTTSTVATVSISVSSVNDVPDANADSYATDEDEPLSVDAANGVLANDTDVDGDPLTAILVTGPTHGELTFNEDGSFEYTPDANYNGPDSFTYQVSDGTTLSSVAVVSFTINSVNDTPVANADSYSTQEDAPLNVTAIAGVLANDTDVEADTLTALLVSDVTHGTLTLNANGSFTYTPADDYNGLDEFTYTATDGTTTSTPVTVTLTIGAVNDIPVANNDSYGTDEDTPLVVTAPGALTNDTDDDGDALSAVLVSQPGHGVVTLDADGSFTYTPGPDFNGNDSFTYQTDDGTALSGVATVFIAVTSFNDAPTVVDSAPNVDEDGSLVVLAPGVLTAAADVDGDTVTALLIDEPVHGTLTLNSDGSYTYTPDADYNGPDSFTFAGTDGIATSAVATVSITVNPVNDTPTVVDSTPNVDEDEVLEVSAPGVLTGAGDVDGDPLTAVLIDGPIHGELTLNPDGSYTYTPEPDFNGLDCFTFVANDGTTVSATGTVCVTVNSVNDIPLVQDSAPTIDEDGTLTVSGPGVLTDAADVDADDLTAVLLDGPAHGELTLNPDGSYSYTPDANFHGTDCFTFAAFDGTVNSATGTVCVTVNSLNDAPTAQSSTPSVDEDGVLEVAAPGALAGATDDDGDELTAVLIEGPSHGVLALNADGSYTYTPAANFHGTDCFTFVANDGTVNSPEATVCITVNSINDEPVAAADSYQIAEDDELALPAPGVLTNDTDVDGDSLSALLVTGPAHGLLTLNANGSFTYVPDDNFSGSDSFTYVATDGALTSAVATVTLLVDQVNGAGDIDLLAGSVSFGKNWTRTNIDRLRLKGRVNPRGSRVDLAGATVLVTINGVDIATPIVLDAKGRGTLTLGKTKIRVFLSSINGKYKINIRRGDLTAALGLSDAQAKGMTNIDILLTITDGDFDVTQIGGIFETPYKTTAGKSSRGRFKFKTHRTLTGVFNSNRTVAKLGKAGGYSIAFRGAIENVNDTSLVPTDTIRVQIGDNVLTLPPTAISAKLPGLKSFRLAPLKHTFRLTTKELDLTGIPLPGPGAPTVYRLPMMIQYPSGTVTNTFETIIELKRANETATKWKR